uniref:Uncharacterized protein n=1 Tax=Odontella aurita TaxID=265563 RepID=A0A7S4NFN3_9STRA|mmetsp:Transcript_61744/g.182344  ORF Transcript_61744/g.182344 Transcript_61744/m.182344 type:complete len:203 (+) Transcript_61744:365-973(+)
MKEKVGRILLRPEKKNGGPRVVVLPRLPTTDSVPPGRRRRRTPSFFGPKSYYERERKKKVDAALESAKDQLIAVINRKTRGVAAVRWFFPVRALSESIIKRCQSNPKFSKLTPEEQLYFAEELFNHGCTYCYGSPPAWRQMERHLRRFAEAMELEIAESPTHDGKGHSVAQRNEHSNESQQSPFSRLAKTIAYYNCTQSGDS